MPLFKQDDQPSLEERWRRLEWALSPLTEGDRPLLQERDTAQRDLATLASERCLTMSALKMRLTRDWVKAALSTDWPPNSS